MIIIATHNGWDYLHENLSRIKALTGFRWPVVVVDTKSTDLKFREYAEKTAREFGADFIQCEDGDDGYETGALLKAYRKYPNQDIYFILQDSLYMKTGQLLDVFEEGLNTYDVIAWHFFSEQGSGFYGEPGRFHVPENPNIQRDWLKQNFGTDSYTMGIYGPVFAIRKGALDKLVPRLDTVRINDKMTATGMERAWPILIRQNLMSLVFLEQWKGSIFSEAYTFFVKAPRKEGPRM